MGQTVARSFGVAERVARLVNVMAGKQHAAPWLVHSLRHPLDGNEAAARSTRVGTPDIPIWLFARCERPCLAGAIARRVNATPERWRLGAAWRS
jgi:putative alpha-1,2-mannosidase